MPTLNASSEPGKPGRPVKVWVIDASSIIDLRQLPGKEDRSRDAVFDSLTELVDQGRLFYPPQVLAEVLRFGASVAQEWAKKNAENATKYKPTYADIKPILAKIPNLIDHTKSGTDQADPYIIVAAQRLEADGRRPTIITEDRKKQEKNKQQKVPLSSAAGVFDFPSVALYVFLETEGIITA